MTNLLKFIIKSLPGIRDVVTQRDDLIRDRDKLISERDTLVIERDSLVAQRDTLVGERDSLVIERDNLVAQRDTLIGERDSLVIERDNLVGQRDTLVGERDSLVIERDSLVAQRDTLVGERDSLVIERDSLVAQRDTLVGERDSLVIERDNLVAQRDTLVGERDSLVIERDSLVAQRDTSVGERDSLVIERDSLCAQRENLVSERDKIVNERDKLVNELDKLRPYSPEHYDSPIPSLAEVRRDDTKLFGGMPRGIRGIDLAESEQLRLLEKFLPYYEAMPFTPFKKDSLRYYFENDWYSYSDAIMLHCIMRHLRPTRIIEVGSGFSSCVMLDTNEHFFQNSIKMTLIEPQPERLYSLLKPHDKGSITVLEQRLQDININIFEKLQANDILFIDSTHVSKIGSDVNQVFFDILPRLPSGVNIHFHDIFYPFEYPREWIYGGRAWNELYTLRAFLEYNSEFQIVLFNTFMEEFHEQFFREKMPLCLKNRGGSVWIRRR